MSKKGNAPKNRRQPTVPQGNYGTVQTPLPANTIIPPTGGAVPQLMLQFLGYNEQGQPIYTYAPVDASQAPQVQPVILPQPPNIQVQPQVQTISTVPQATPTPNVQAQPQVQAVPATTQAAPTPSVQTQPQVQAVPATTQAAPTPSVQAQSMQANTSMIQNQQVVTPTMVQQPMPRTAMSQTILPQQTMARPIQPIPVTPISHPSQPMGVNVSVIGQTRSNMPNVIRSAVSNSTKPQGHIYDMQKKHGPVVGSIEDALSFMGEDTSQYRRNKDNEVDIPHYREYKQRKSTPPAMIRNRPMVSDFDETMFLSKRELRRRKKNEKLEAKRKRKANKRNHRRRHW